MRVVGNVVAYYSKADYPSHHYLCNFWVKGVLFSSMEQMMMYSKAMYFKDPANAKRIMATNNCQAQKMIGRDVTPFDKEEWDEKSLRIVVAGNIQKYKQNLPILSLLMATGDKILVEASERDTLWGCGLNERDDRIADPSQWLGQNRHGQGQMMTRDYFHHHRGEIQEMDYTTLSMKPTSRFY